MADAPSSINANNDSCTALVMDPMDSTVVGLECGSSQSCSTLPDPAALKEAITSSGESPVVEEDTSVDDSTILNAVVNAVRACDDSPSVVNAEYKKNVLLKETSKIENEIISEKRISSNVLPNSASNSICSQNHVNSKEANSEIDLSTSGNSANNKSTLEKLPISANSLECAPSRTSELEASLSNNGTTINNDSDVKQVDSETNKQELTEGSDNNSCKLIQGPDINTNVESTSQTSVNNHGNEGLNEQPKELSTNVTSACSDALHVPGNVNAAVSNETENGKHNNCLLNIEKVDTDHETRNDIASEETSTSCSVNEADTENETSNATSSGETSTSCSKKEKVDTGQEMTSSTASEETSTSCFKNKKVDTDQEITSLTASEENSTLCSKNEKVDTEQEVTSLTAAEETSTSCSKNEKVETKQEMTSLTASEETSTSCSKNEKVDSEQEQKVTSLIASEESSTSCSKNEKVDSEQEQEMTSFTDFEEISTSCSKHEKVDTEQKMTSLTASEETSPSCLKNEQVYVECTKDDETASEKNNLLELNVNKPHEEAMEVDVKDETVVKHVAVCGDVATDENSEPREATSSSLDDVPHLDIKASSNNVENEITAEEKKEEFITGKNESLSAGNNSEAGASESVNNVIEVPELLPITEGKNNNSSSVDVPHNVTHSDNVNAFESSDVEPSIGSLSTLVVSDDGDKKNSSQHSNNTVTEVTAQPTDIPENMVCLEVTDESNGKAMTEEPKEEGIRVHDTAVKKDETILKSNADHGAFCSDNSDTTNGDKVSDKEFQSTTDTVVSASGEECMLQTVVGGVLQPLSIDTLASAEAEKVDEMLMTKDALGDVDISEAAAINPTMHVLECNVDEADGIGGLVINSVVGAFGEGVDEPLENESDKDLADLSANTFPIMDKTQVCDSLPPAKRPRIEEPESHVPHTVSFKVRPVKKEDVFWDMAKLRGVLQEKGTILLRLCLAEPQPDEDFDVPSDFVGVLMNAADDSVALGMPQHPPGEMYGVGIDGGFHHQTPNYSSYYHSRTPEGMDEDFVETEEVEESLDYDAASPQSPNWQDTATSVAVTDHQAVELQDISVQDDGMLPATSAAVSDRETPDLSVQEDGEEEDEQLLLPQPEELYENENAEKERQYEQHKQMLLQNKLKRFPFHGVTYGLPGGRAYAFQCQTCNRGFSRKKLFEKHLRTHQPENKCSYCSFKTRNKKQFEAHELRHLKVNPQFECEVCKARYATSSLLRGHIARQHRLFHCSECSHVSTSFDDRNNHLVEAHDMKPFRRKSKGRYFFEKYVRDEVIDEPSSQMGHVCDICQKTYRTRALLKIHVAHHLKVNPSRLNDDFEICDDNSSPQNSTPDLTDDDTGHCFTNRGVKRTNAGPSAEQPPAKKIATELSSENKSVVDNPEINLLARIRPASQRATYYCGKCELELSSPHDLFLHVVTQHTFVEYDRLHRNGCSSSSGAITQEVS